MTTIYIIFAFITGGLLTLCGFKYYITNLIKNKYISKDIVKSKLNAVPKKRGLLTTNFDINDQTKNTTITVGLQCEFVVITETDKKVKLKIIDISVNNMNYSDEYYINMYKKSFSSWYNTADKSLEFFKETKLEIRKRNLKELLG